MAGEWRRIVLVLGLALAADGVPDIRISRQ
jgi:hypothetical protein